VKGNKFNRNDYKFGLNPYFVIYRFKKERIKEHHAGYLLHLRSGLRDGVHRHSHPTVREEVGRPTTKTSGQAAEATANKTVR